MVNPEQKVRVLHLRDVGTGLEAVEAAEKDCCPVLAEFELSASVAPDKCPTSWQTRERSEGRFSVRRSVRYGSWDTR
jgi:hypothetical protein